jgi:hypothetical protein
MAKNGRRLAPYRVDRRFAGHAMKPAFGAESKPNSDGWTLLLFGSALRASAPPLAFVTGATVVNLCTGAVFAAGLSLMLLGIQRWRRASMRSPLIGLVLTLACGIVAARSGQTRDFFLLPLAVPAMAILACLGTIIVRRPLVGLLVHPFTGGPRQWWHEPRFRDLYHRATWGCIVINVFNGGSQIFLYAMNSPLALVVVHGLTAPAFGALATVAAILGRRAAAKPSRSVVQISQVFDPAPDAAGPSSEGAQERNLRVHAHVGAAVVASAAASPTTTSSGNARGAGEAEPLRRAETSTVADLS